jgi:flagellar protein FlgJ
MDPLTNAMPPQAAAMTGTYLDFGGIGKLKGQAHSDAKAATRETAQQFEAMFLQMMMKTMRDAVPKSGLNESAAEETFQGMFDKEVSLAMAKRSTLGIADLLMKHMPDPNAAPPSTAQMLQARQPKSMPLQVPAANPMALQAAAQTLAPLPKAPGAMPLTGVYAASPSGLAVTNSQATDGAKP